MAGCPECGLPLCKHCIDIKISSGTSSNTNTNTDIGTNKKKCLVWHEAECRLLKNNSVRVSLEEKDEKEASKVIMTAFQYNHSFGFQKPMKVKVVK